MFFCICFRDLLGPRYNIIYFVGRGHPRPRPLVTPLPYTMYHELKAAVTTCVVGIYVVKYDPEKLQWNSTSSLSPVLSRVYTGATCCRQHAACISATRIHLYSATDGQQTSNNFVAGNMLLVAGNMLPWCKRGFMRPNTVYLKCPQTITLATQYGVRMSPWQCLHVLTMLAWHTSEVRGSRKFWFSLSTQFR